MRRFAVLAVLVLAGGLPAAPARSQAGGFMSPNVTHVAHIPIDAPGVSARLREVEHPVLGLQKRLYVSGVKGLSIYDVTTPTLPLLIGHLPLPHWQNEDIDVSLDGSRTFVAVDSFGPVFIVDTSIVHAPRLAGVVPFGSQHTISCGDPACNYIFGNYGQTFDVSDPLNPFQVQPGWGRQLEDQMGEDFRQDPHDLNRDDAGIFIADSVPRVMFYLQDGDPLRPRLLTTGDMPDGANLRYQHNNVRPRADEWAPRASGDDAAALRPGELMVANGETNLEFQCDGTNGPVATWSVANFDRGQKMQHLDTFRPLENGLWADGNAAVNVLGCSGHYFGYNESNDVLAGAFFEHGVRFLHIDPANGDITEVGFFQPVRTSVGATYWIDDEYLLTTDYGFGIDILRFDSDPALRPSEAQITQSWLASLHAEPTAPAKAEQYACRIAMEGSTR